jgi:hypothetical protein
LLKNRGKKTEGKGRRERTRVKEGMRGRLHKREREGER